MSSQNTSPLATLLVIIITVIALFSLSITLDVWSIFDDRGPDKTAIRELLIEDIIPDFVEAGDLKIIARQNMGLETDPRIKARFEIKVILLKDTFKRLRSLRGRPIIQPQEKVGKEAFFYGTATSRPVEEGWVTNITFDVRPWRSWGTPFEGFTNKPLLEGSQELLSFQQKIMDDGPITLAGIEAENQSNLIKGKTANEKLISIIRGFDGIGFEKAGDITSRLHVDFHNINQETFEISGRHYYRDKTSNFFGKIENGILKYTYNKNLNVQLTLSPEGKLLGTYSKLSSKTPLGRINLNLIPNGIALLNQLNKELLEDTNQKYFAEGDRWDTDDAQITFNQDGLGEFHNDRNANPKLDEEYSGFIDYSFENGFVKIRFFEPNRLGKRCVAFLEYDGISNFVGTREGCPAIKPLTIYLK